MKLRINKKIKWSTLILITTILYSFKFVNDISIPAELLGQWKSDKTKITVRTEPKWMKFTYTSDSAIVTLKINSDNTASGFIGNAKFENAMVKKNGGNPDKTGISYIIKCGTIGKIFDKDPTNGEEVEIWLQPIRENGTLPG